MVQLKFLAPLSGKLGVRPGFKFSRTACSASRSGQSPEEAAERRRYLDALSKARYSGNYDEALFEISPTKYDFEQLQKTVEQLQKTVAMYGFWGPAIVVIVTVLSSAPESVMGHYLLTMLSN